MTSRKGDNDKEAGALNDSFRRPLVGITMGDPAGIGPEIALRAVSECWVNNKVRPLIIGDAGVLDQVKRMLRLELVVEPVREPTRGAYEPGRAAVLDCRNVDRAALIPGTISADCGRASLQYIETGIALALGHQIDALATGPIHKQAIRLAGCPFAGHTELLAARTHTSDYVMMLVVGTLRVAHVTTHIPLADVPARITQDAVFRTIRLAHRATMGLGVSHPRIEVLGLNPHASDGGLFGVEEAKEIEPAVAHARAIGINVAGPVPPDTAFTRLRADDYDVAVAMYHDQGHIPLKLLAFDWDADHKTWRSVSGVNVTLGLPIIRTSVDHGVAFDRAGQGTARPDSLLDAIELAARLASTPDKPRYA